MEINHLPQDVLERKEAQDVIKKYTELFFNAMTVAGDVVIEQANKDKEFSEYMKENAVMEKTLRVESAGLYKTAFDIAYKRYIKQYMED